MAKKFSVKKMLLSVVALASVAALSIAGTVAYLQDSDGDVNVMTLGNVSIEQHEYQRAEGVAHDAGDMGAGNGVKEGALVPFKKGQAIYPAVPKNNVSTDYSAEQNDEDLFFWGDYVYTGTAGNGLWDDNNLSNVMDKMVFVENTGKSDAYFRTILAFECPVGMTIGEAANGAEIMINTNGSDLYTWAEVGFITVDNVRYFVWEATYQKALAAGNQAHPSLLQAVLTHHATNEDMELLGGTYEIIALSQAVQAAGFSDAKTALDTAFGASADKAAEWMGGMDIPVVDTYYEGVAYVIEGKTATVNSDGGTVLYRGILSDGQSEVTEVYVGEGIERLNNRALCKAPALEEVTLPESLTYIDEGAFQQSGIKEITVPQNVTYIGKQAFGACGSLEKIVINAKDVTIANYVARACANLKEVYIYSDSVTFESGSMYFTNKENGDASAITFYVKDQAMADNLYNAFSTSHSYGLLIKSLDGATVFYNTLK